MAVEDAVKTTVDLHLAFLDTLGIALPLAARILDFGCGAGAAVAYLCRREFDCYGIDVAAGGPAISHDPAGACRAAFPDWRLEWDKSTALAGRVFPVSPDDYRLPFPDRSFDFCFSDQVFEHVHDYAAVFREIGRVLKPGALSLHRFPGPNRLIEGHAQLPIPLLCRNRAYLGLWALAGRRAPHQGGLSWRDTVQDNRRMMSQTFYPTKARLRRYARQAGIWIEFCERWEFATCSAGALAVARRRLERVGLGGLARLLLPLLAQRYMLLRSAG